MAASGATGCPPNPEVSALPYPTPERSTEGEVVARIGDVVLTRRELEKRLAAQSPFTQKQLTDPDKLRTFIENQVRLELLAQEGWARGLTRDPEIMEGFKRVVVDRVTRDALREIAANLQITDVDLQNAYRARFAEFNRPPTVRVSQITRQATTAAERDQAYRLLDRLKRDISAQARKSDLRAFSREARKHSQEPSVQKTGGDLRFLTQEAFLEHFGPDPAKKFFGDLPVGEMLIVSKEGFVILIMKTGQRRGMTRTLEQVKPQIRARLIADKRTEAFDAFIKGLKEKHGVTMRETAIEDVRRSIPEPPDEEKP